MGLIERTARALGFERRATNPNDTWAAFQALRTASITPESAQSVAAVYGAVAVISEAIGTLPLRLYKRGDDSRTPADDHALHKCLHREPNEHQSSQEFIEWMTAAKRLYYPEFSAEGLLRGDSEVRAAFYASGIGAGWLLPAEARKLENLPAIKATHYRPNPPPKGAA